MTNLTFTLGIIASLATIASGIIATIRYLGRSRVIEEMADRLGVDLAMLVLPGEDSSAERVTFLKDNFTPEQLVVAAGESKRLLALNHAAALAASENDTSVLIEEALEHDDVPRSDRLGEHLSDKELEELIDERGLWPDPIETVARLEDSRERAYAWILSDDATEEDRASLATEIEETFVQMNQSEPDALHFIVRNTEELKELDSETVEKYVKPWLKESNSNEESD